MELERVERELEALLAQQAAPDLPVWEALLTERSRFLMHPDAQVLARSQELTSRLIAYFEETRARDSAELAALRRTAALHEVIRVLGESRLGPTFSVEG